MENNGGWIAGLGVAVGTLIYAGAEIGRRLLRKAPNDPFTKKIEKDIEALQKSVNALSSQLDYMAKDHHSVERRVAKIEQNGKSR